MFRTVSVIGGDLRQLTLAKMLIADGYNVVIYGFENDTDNIMNTHDLEFALNSDIIILPVPVSFDNIYINTPFTDEKIPLDGLPDKINPLSVVFGGKIPASLSKKLTARGIMHHDYMVRSELAIRNAVPTALMI